MQRANDLPDEKTRFVINSISVKVFKAKKRDKLIGLACVVINLKFRVLG